MYYGSSKRPLSLNSYVSSTYVLRSRGVLPVHLLDLRSACEYVGSGHSPY